MLNVSSICRNGWNIGAEMEFSNNPLIQEKLEEIKKKKN